MTLKQKYASVEDLLRKHRTASNEQSLVSEIPNKINQKNVSLHWGRETNSFNPIQDGGGQKGPLPVFLL